MLGYIMYGGGERRPRIGERQLLGARFVTLDLGESRHPQGYPALRRADRAAGRLAELGVRRAVFPVDFPYTVLFARRGVCPVDTLPLRRALAAPLTRRRLEELGLGPTRAVAAVSADRMSQEVADTVRALALGYRYVLLDAPGGEDLARTLRRDHGISLLLGPSRQQLDRADALLLFAPRGDLRLKNPVLCTLYPGGEEGPGHVPLPLPGNLDGQVEPGGGREQLTAALCGMGLLQIENILTEIP